MPTIINNRSSLITDPLRNFRFLVTFKPLTDATGAPISTATSNLKSAKFGFTSVSGMAVTTDSIPYREGGYNTTVHQIPGMTTFSPVTFTRGVLFGNDQAISWMRGLFSAAQGSGLNNGATGTGAIGNFRVDIVLSVNEHPNTNANADFPKMKFKIHNAWITALNYTDLDATNGAILFETMQLVHEGLSVYFTKADGTPADGLSETVY